MIWRNYVTVTLYIQHLAARRDRFFKLNDLHISTFLHVSSVMTDMSRDSIVDRSSLLALALCAVCRQLAFEVAENLWEVSCTECRPIGQWNDFELIPTVKIESRHPVQGSFGNEFPSIYNHCGVMTAWSCKTLKKAFFAFFGKTTLNGKIFKICSERIHRDADRRVVFKLREIWQTEVGKIVRTVSARKWIRSCFNHYYMQGLWFVHFQQYMSQARPLTLSVRI